jgi:hypothetical protein
MKTPTNSRRGAAAAVATAALLTAVSSAAPKKKTEPTPAPAPVVEQQPAPKKSFFGKLKSSVGIGKKEETPAPATVETKPAAKTVPATKGKPPVVQSNKPAPKTPAPVVEKVAEKKSAPVSRKQAEKPAPVNGKTAKTKNAPPPAAEPAPAPEKKGFFKKLFGSKSKPEEAPAEPNLAKVKTAKPAPVKEVKPVKPAPNAPGAPVAVEEPKKKRGFFSFLRGDRNASQGDAGDSAVPESEKIVRPADWKDHRVVKEDAVGLYEFGPSQSNGPDTRLDRGAVVKIKRVEKGWALVQTLNGHSGYLDAAALRDAVEGDFTAPVVRSMATASVSPDAWAPAAPPPDLPDHPASLDNESGLLLLPPLELEPKKKQAPPQ